MVKMKNKVIKMNLYFIYSLIIILVLFEELQNGHAKLLENCKKAVCLKNDKDGSVFHSFVQNKLKAEDSNQSVSDYKTENSLLTENEILKANEYNLNNSFFKNSHDSSNSEIDIKVNDDKQITLEKNESLIEFMENKLLSTTAAFDDVMETINQNTDINISSTSLPPHDILAIQNKSNFNKICFCDLTFNQCDINCCCDKDCTLTHYNIFTKCIDSDIENEKNYCLKHSFIFKNNTFVKTFKGSRELFCIVKDNSRFSFFFKKKSLLTNLDSFNKSLPKTFFSFSSRNYKKLDIVIGKYKAGLPVWTIQNNVLKPLGIPAPSFGSLCTSQINVKYLINEMSKCSYKFSDSKFSCESLKTMNFLNNLKHTRIISSPVVLNKSHAFNATEVCEIMNCVGVTIYLCQDSSSLPCTVVTEKSLNKVGCLDKILYNIKHNGSEGIKNFEAYLWVKNISKKPGKNFLQTTEVKYSWVGSSEKIFKWSGNPGYQIGKPILAGKKVYYTMNNTSVKKEAIELSLNSNDWLNVLASEKGICSSTKRISINFKEDSINVCSIKVIKKIFDKEKCIELQNKIFKLLIGNEIINATTENYFNKFVGVFGNSKVENAESWVQVLIDLYPLISSQVGFKSNYNNFICKNIITDLFINVAFVNVGFLKNPQSKILGVSFNFGNHKDLIFYCDNPNCGNTSSIQNIKLSTAVHFIDLTEPAIDTFAEPIGLEIKLPHDFFYPFFSKGNKSHFQFNIMCFIIFVVSINIQIY